MKKYILFSLYIFNSAYADMSRADLYLLFVSHSFMTVEREIPLFVLDTLEMSKEFDQWPSYVRRLWQYQLNLLSVPNKEIIILRGPPKPMMDQMQQELKKLLTEQCDQLINAESTTCPQKRKPLTPEQQTQLDEELVQAVRKRTPDIVHVKTLLSQGANPNSTTADKDPLLIKTLIDKPNKSDELIFALIDAGADIGAQRPYSLLTPLMIAVQEKRTAIIDRLLQEWGEKNRDIKMNSQSNPPQWTALMSAVSHCDPETAKKLLAHGADKGINYKNAQGNTALLLAIGNLYQCDDETHEEPLIRALLEAGADPRIKNNAGNTASDILKNHPATPPIKKLLLEYEDSKHNILQKDI